VSAVVLRMLYFAFVYPHLLYCVEVYANTHSSYLEKLMVLNNKILHIVQFKPLKTHVLNLYKNYNTLPVPKLHQFQLLCLIHEFF